MKKIKIIIVLFIICITLQLVSAQEDIDDIDNNSNDSVNSTAITHSNNEKNKKDYSNIIISNDKVVILPQTPSEKIIEYYKPTIDNYSYYKNTNNLVVEGKVDQTLYPNITLEINDYEKLKSNGNLLEKTYNINLNSNGSYKTNIKVDINEPFNITVHNWPNNETLYKTEAYIDNFSNESYIINAQTGEELFEEIPVVDKSFNKINNGYLIFKINGLTIKDEYGNNLKSNVSNGKAFLNYTIPNDFKRKNYTLETLYIDDNQISKSFRINYTLNINKDISLSTNIYQYNNLINELIIKPKLLIDNKSVQEGFLIAKINDETIKDIHNNTKKMQLNIENNYFSIPIRDNWYGKTFKITVIYSISTYGRIESIDYYTIQPPASSLTNSTYENSSKKKINLDITVTPITNKVIILGFIITDNNIPVSGINTIGVKINYITLKDKDNNPLLFTVKDGFFLFTINCSYSKPYNLTLTIGERNQYEGSRTTLTVDPKKVINDKIFNYSYLKNRIIDYYSINPLII